MNEQWRQQLKEKMADYRRPAPEVSWEEIYKALDAHKTRQLWLRCMAAAAVLLLVVGVGYWLFHHDDETAEHLTAIATNNQQLSIPAHRGERCKPSAQGVRNDVISGTSHAFLTPCASLCDTQAEESQSSTEKIESQTDEVDYHIEDVPSSTVEKRTPSPVHPSEVFYPSDPRHRKHQDNRLTAKVYLSNTMNDSYRAESSIRQITETTIKSYPNYPTYSEGEIDGEKSGETDPPNTSPSDNPITPVIVYDTITTIYKSQTVKQIRHRQPIRFGLSLRYRIDNRWSIESGLSYTRLVTDITTITDGQLSLTEQRLNYIGLPLNVGYQLWTNRHFGLYVIAGGTIEKMLDASPWQFSLSGAAGAEYRLTDIFSLYAEPGIGYYFSDGSATPVIYQDHPFNVNLSFGLRINLK